MGTPAKRLTVRSSSSSVRSGRWWNSTTRRAPGRSPSPTAYSAAAWPKSPRRRPPRPAGGRRGRGGPRRAASSRAASWYAPSRRAVPEDGRAVVGQVGDRRPAVADTVAERLSALVGDLDGAALEALRPRTARGYEAEPPVPAKLRGRDREEGGDIMRSATLRAVPSSSPGRSRVTRVVAVARREEGSPWTWSQCRCVSRTCRGTGRSPEELVHTPQPCPGVEQQRGASAPSWVSGDARGVPAVADEVGPRCGRRPPRPAEGDAHRSVSRVVLAAMPRGQLLEMRAIDRSRLEHGDPAGRDGDVARRPDAALEVRPLTEQGPGPVLSQTLAVASRPARSPSRIRNTSLPGSPCCDEMVAAGEPARSAACRRPCISWAESCVSSADSTAVTRASESWSPHGLCFPNDLRYQSLKSVSPDLCDERVRRRRRPSAAGTGWHR